MAITRLPADANDLDITFTVPKELRPYLTKWFQETKLQGETVEQFILRQLKESAKNDYLGKEIQSELASIDSARNANADALIADVEVFKGEL